MYIPKAYGQSGVDSCPFCGKVSLVKNKQGIPVCTNHKGAMLSEMRCACGKWLDLHQGKWGPYFHCENCGNMNLKKALGVNNIMNPKKEICREKEITIRSDQLDTLYT